MTKRVIGAIDAELQQRTAAELPDFPAPEPDPHAERAAQELLSAAEVLDPSDRELLFDREGLDGRRQQGILELSTRRGCSAATLKRRLDDVREQLRIELVKRGWRDRTSKPAEQPQSNIG